MIQIKLLKDWQSKKAGEIINISKSGAEQFIATGAAEYFNPEKEDIAFPNFEEINSLPDVVEKQRVWLKDYAGLHFSIGENELECVKWKEGIDKYVYSDKRFGEPIPCLDGKYRSPPNKIQRHPKRVCIEFDEPREQAQQHLEKGKDKLKSLGGGYIQSTHNSTKGSDYLWVEFNREITDKEAEQFLMWIAPEGSEIDMNFASSNRRFPVLFAEHWKYPKQRELPVEYFKGKKIDFDSLNIKPQKKIKKNVTKQNGEIYETFVKSEITQNWVEYICPHCGKTISEKPNANVLCWHETQTKPVRRYSYPMYPVGFVKESIPKELLEIVKSPDFFKLLLKESEKRIVGEEPARKTLILCTSGGRLVKNAKTTSYNNLASALSGAGKDHTTQNSLKLIPQGYWDHKTRLSEKALSYWHPAEQEPFWDWGGRVLYVEDVSNSFLNCETTKVMMTGGSDISIVDKGKLKTLKINGSPVFVLTSATAEPNAELSRRISSVPLDISDKQTERVLEFQKTCAIQGIPIYDSDLVNSAYLLKRVEVTIPFAELIVNKFPKKLSARTNFDRLLDLIKASAALHQYTREEDNKHRIIANSNDFKLGLEVFNLLFPMRSASLTHAQQSIVNYLEQIKAAKSAAEIFRETGHSYYSQINVLIEGLRSLANKGFLEISEQQNERGKSYDVYKFIQDTSKNELLDLTNITNLTNISSISNLSKDNKKKLGNLGHLGSLSDLSNNPILVKVNDDLSTSEVQQ